MQYPDDEHEYREASSDSSGDDLAMLGMISGTAPPNLALATLQTNIADLHEGDPRTAFYSATKASETIPPDYGTPDFSVPPLSMGDLSTPNVVFMPEFTPDPMLPDLDEYQQPAAVEMVSDPDGMQPEADYTSDVPEQAEIDTCLDAQPGLGFTQLEATHDVEDDDPMLPDLQHPQLEQEDTDPGKDDLDPSDERPGDMADAADETLSDSLDADNIAGKPYDTVYSDASGNNSTRTRHMDMLIQGLKGLMREEDE